MKCLVCSQPVPRGSFLCIKCSEEAEKGRFDSFMVRCGTCHAPLASTDYVCTHCKTFPGFPVYSVYDYSSAFNRRLLERYKFENQKDLASYAASVYAQALAAAGAEPDNSLLIPVPCSESSLRKRGWDQMLEAAKELGKRYRYRYAAVISNTGDKQQKDLDSEQRKTFSKRRYAIKNTAAAGDIRRLNKGRCVVLLDDVMTTGSTLAACKTLLSDAGFSDIEAATWLREL